MKLNRHKSPRPAKNIVHFFWGRLSTKYFHLATALIITLSLTAPPSYAKEAETAEYPFKKNAHNPRIAPSLKQLMNNSSRPNKEIRVIVRLRKQFDEKVKKHIKRVNRQRTVARLKTDAQNNHKALIHFLKRKQYWRTSEEKKSSNSIKTRGKGNTGPSRSFWLTNSVAISVYPEALKTIAEHPDVIEIIENRTLSIPPLDLNASNSSDPSNDLWNHSAIGLYKSKDRGLDGSGVKVGHLDTGIDPSHPELAGKIIDWAEFDPMGNSVKSEPHETDYQSHGTHTAEVMAGNSTGIAPGVSILSALVLQRGYGTIEQVLAGMQWVMDPDNDPATDDGAQIVNMSWGMPGNSEILREAVKNMADAGILPVCAIGNYGIGYTLTPGNVPEAIGVGSVDEMATVPTFSGGGETSWDGVYVKKPDITAPGVRIPVVTANGEHLKRTGTSFAAPHVAAVAALLLEYSPNLTLNQLRGFLLNTARCPAWEIPVDRYGRGMLDCGNAFDFFDRYEPRFESADLVLETIELINGSEICKNHVSFFQGDNLSSGEEIISTPGMVGMKTLGLADVNGDGYSDIVAGQTSMINTTQSPAAYYVYFSEDAKGFSENGVNWYSPPEDTFKTFEFKGLADVDGDEKSDLILSTQETAQYGQVNIQIHVLRSNGKDHFEKTPYPWATFTTSVQIKTTFSLGDINGDGRADLVCELRYGDQFSGSYWRPVSYIAAMSSGSRFADFSYWLSVAPSPISGPIDFLAMSDVDGDGFDDLILRDRGTGLKEQIQVYACRSNGKNRFYRNLVWAVLNRNDGLMIESVSDVNGDGAGDLVINSCNTDSRFNIWTSNGKSSFTESESPWIGRVPLSLELQPGTDIHFTGSANIGLGNWK